MNKKVVLFFLTVAGMRADAQDSAMATLDEVVVTATKYPVKLSETGKVVNVINSEQIRRSSGKSLAQILTEQSGIVVNGANSNPGKDKSLFLRGASNDYTLILINGVPVNDATGTGGAVDLRLFPVEEIERIEILKGSQSTLYGSDAIAGVINIITKKGGDKKIGMSGGANYGSFNSFNGNAGIDGKLGNTDYNVSYTYSTSDGISEAFDSTGKAGFDRDGLMRHAFQSSFGIKAGKRVKISPYYRYSYYKGGFDADAFTDGDNQFNALLNTAGAIATITLPNGSITANYGYSYAKREYVPSFSAPFKGRFNTGDVYWTQQLNDRVKLLAGVNYQSNKLLDTSTTRKNADVSIISPYFSFFVQLPAGLNVEAGMRYNNHSEFGSNLTYSVNTSYLIAKQLKVFANLSTGFKAPTVTDLYGLYGSNPDLKPEQSAGIEAGAQFFALDNKLQLTATGYYRRINDLIAYVGTRLINIDKQRDRGAELEARFRPNDKLTIQASFNYVTGNLYQSRDGKDTSFFNLIRRPKTALVASVSYRPVKKLYFGLSLQNLAKRTDLYFAPPTYGAHQVFLDAYVLLNAYVEYKVLDERLRLFMDVRNITDTDFTEVYGYSAMGTNFTGGFRFNL